MRVIRKGIPREAPKHKQYEFQCPDCRSRLMGYEFELDRSYITDYSFVCPVCGRRRHISREEIKEA